MLQLQIKQMWSENSWGFACIFKYLTTVTVKFEVGELLRRYLIMLDYYAWLLHMGVCTLSCFSYVWLFVTPWTVACQAPLSTGFSRQEYWSGLPFSSTPGDLPDPGIEPVSLASPALQVDSLPNVPLGQPGKNKQEAKLAFWLLNEQRISDPKETERGRAQDLSFTYVVFAYPVESF